MASTEIHRTTKEQDSIVCFCYRLTTRQLKECYARCGSLQGVEKETRAGSGCAGCKIVLQSLFNETPSDIYKIDAPPTHGTSCVKPGARVMRGFIIANGDIESTVYSSNGIAPQLGDCDSSTTVNWALVDHRGIPVLHGTETVKTNETFTFTTRDKDIPRPLYGQFLLGLDRSNFGAARFNIQWSTGKSTCSTHENATTGRPDVFFPLIVDQGFLEGPNTIFLGMTNPHAKTVAFTVRVFDLESTDEIIWESELPTNCSMWINANEHLYAPFLKRSSTARVALQIRNSNLEIHEAITTYFFIHNKVLDIWSTNHL